MAISAILTARRAYTFANKLEGIWKIGHSLSQLDAPTKSSELRPWPISEALHKPFFAAFLVSWALNACLLFFTQKRFIAEAHAGLVLAMAATTLIGLARRLPAQNVITASILIGVVSLGLLRIGLQCGIPFGSFQFTPKTKPQILGVPWVMLIYWLVLAILARGVARLAVRPWRKTLYYGYWMIGLGVVIVLIVTSSAEPLLGRIAGYRIWHTRAGMWTWYGMPWSNWLGTAVSFLGIYVLATPWLINKQPVKQPVDYHPLIILLLLEIYLATANSLARFWSASTLGIVATIALVFLALRGARW